MLGTVFLDLLQSAAQRFFNWAVFFLRQQRKLSTQLKTVERDGHQEHNSISAAECRKWVRICRPAHPSGRSGMGPEADIEPVGLE